VVIRWPSEEPAQVMRNLDLDTRYVVREGSAAALPLVLSRVTLGGARPR
jgi:hypothetical protein